MKFHCKNYLPGTFCPEMTGDTGQIFGSLPNLSSDYCDPDQKKMFPHWFITNMIAN